MITFLLRLFGLKKKKRSGITVVFRDNDEVFATDLHEIGDALKRIPCEEKKKRS